MKAAIVKEAGASPVYGDFADPVSGEGTTLVRVTEAPLTHLARGRAMGGHYSAKGTFPMVPGVDGAGITEDGRRVYFFLPEAPYGGMAEYTLAKSERLVPIPDGLDDCTAAALANPGMSSWAGLVDRAKMRAGETVLINGATGAAGRLAIQIAKHLGAARVIATGRRSETFDELRRLGADATIQLAPDRAALEHTLEPEFRSGVDIVLDYLWGPSAEAILAAAARGGKDAVPIRFVQLGSMAGSEIALPSAVLRSSALELIGSGLGSMTLAGLQHAIAGVFQAAQKAKFEVAIERIPLADVTRAWEENHGGARVVLEPTPGSA
jgi:NADPH:quinone reductase-like Zn-dependent oxidoreductase